VIKISQVNFGKEEQNTALRKDTIKYTKTKCGSNWKAEKWLGF